MADTSIPQVGLFATVRNRRGYITAVEQYDANGHGRFHRTEVDYADFDGTPTDSLIWELEADKMLLTPKSLPGVTTQSPQESHLFDAMQRSVRWTAITKFLNAGNAESGAPNTYSPYFGALQTEDFQLEPLIKALRMPRIALLIADDVGLGKTIEAGLIITELLIRHRVRRVLILCPSSLRFQWQSEMKEKFCLGFDIVERSSTYQLQRRLGLDANPWRIYSRVIASYHYLRQDDVREQFRSACSQSSGSPRLPWDLLIVDEAHNLMPSAFGESSDLFKLLQTITPHFEHKLFLTATPHNGYTRSFTGILQQLDPGRFSQSNELSEEQRKRLRQVFVRRLKRDLNDEAEKNGLPPRFAEREICPKTITLSEAEKEVSTAFADLKKRLIQYLATVGRREKLVGHFAIEVLNNRALCNRSSEQSAAFLRPYVCCFVVSIP